MHQSNLFNHAVILNKHFAKQIRKVLGFKTAFKFGYENKIKNLLIKNSLKKRMLIQKLTKCIQEN